MVEKVLVAKVLDKLAKEFKIERDEEKRVWKEIPRNYCFDKTQVRRAVELALETKQAEVDLLKAELRLWKPKPSTKEERNSLSYKIAKAGIKAELKKRLLAKSEAKKRNE